MKAALRRIAIAWGWQVEKILQEYSPYKTHSPRIGRQNIGIDVAKMGVG